METKGVHMSGKTQGTRRKESVLLSAAVALALGVLLIPCATTGQQTTAGPVYTVLHAFQGNPDGQSPQAGVIRDSSGGLYGTTYLGGSNGAGVVFKVSASGEETVLYDFTGGGDGGFSIASLIRDSSGNLYGTTLVSGANDEGTVFKLSPTGQETALWSFTGGTDGALPHGSLVRDRSGNLYGTTFSGGDVSCDTFGCGTVFKLTPSGQLTALHTFTGAPDGANPVAGLFRDSSGNLYGTTPYGGDSSCGSFGCGTVFKLTPAGQLTALHTFTGAPDGVYPNAGLVRDASGNLYGTTYGGGTYGPGTVFKVTAAGQQRVLYSFTGSTDGQYPYSTLVRDSRGNLYGTTFQGGAYGFGVVFKLSPSGHESVLYSFTGGTDGGNPYAGLTRDSSGNLYGTTFVGGDLSCNAPSGCGTVFELTP
jgi:uncharacterized repeat protein (TIGR03803 family)